MANLPKVVLKHLRSRADAHPEADMLTAFAEQALPETERDLVIEHLSLCGDCREVVALVLPPVQAADMAVLAHSSRSGWFTMPVLRWGVVTAGVLAVTSFGVLQYRQSHQGKEKQQVAVVTRHEQLNQIPVPTPAPAQTLAVPTEKQTSAPRQTEQTTQLDKRSEARKQLPGMFPQSKATSDADVVTARVLSSPQAASRVPAASISGAMGGTTTVGTQGAAAENQTTEASSQIARNEMQQPPMQGHNVTSLEVTNAEVAKAKDPVPTTAAVVQSPSLALHASPSLMQRAAPLWSISSAGGLQRSFDAGQTWEDVILNSGSISGSVRDPAGAIVSGAGVTLTGLDTTEKYIQSSGGDGRFAFENLLPGRYRIEIEKLGFQRLAQSPIVLDGRQNARFDAALQVGQISETVEVAASAAPVPLAESVAGNTATVKKNRLEQTYSVQAQGKEKENWKHWLAPPQPIFKALAATGPEVWAGGSNSMLYHSLDAGAHWTRVLPSSAGTVLTGDITALEFSDPQHGRITTSASEVWTTADNGQTWLKQP
jgi:hypothetical protein